MMSLANPVAARGRCSGAVEKLPDPTGAAVRSPAEAVQLLAPHLATATSECILVLHLDADRRLLKLARYPGSVNEAALPLRDILADGLRLGSASLVVAHNHPSGEAAPSEEDLLASRALADTARNLGLRLDDHLIFGAGETCSLRDMGLL